METNAWIAAGSMVIAGISALIAGISAFIAYRAVRESRRLQEKQWRRDELVLRRDVLRRLRGFSYRLTESLQGTDGEPFIALNEAWVVYADFPHVTNALTKMHNELGNKDSLRRNIVRLVGAMSVAAEVTRRGLDDKLIERPFTPPVIGRAHENTAGSQGAERVHDNR
ncbi:MAG: hypothetical protein OXM62_04545 [bacterium]|nr:hypothetical protein [bacterium]MDE0234254.1 hypothetical protein [bacterium]